MNDFYVYRYIRLDTNTPFYVGKGRGRRAIDKNHNEYCKRIIDKHGFEIEYLLKNLTEKEAFVKEVEFVKLYKDLGYCEANFTNGGEGASGRKHTEKTKQKLSSDRMGKKNPMFGIKMSEENRKKRSENTKGEKHPMFGKPKSEETKKRISISKTGKMTGSDNHAFGKPKSEETKKRISMTKKGKPNPSATILLSKLTLCVETGIIYKSATEASKALNIPRSSISKVANGIWSQTRGFHFSYL